MGADNILVIKLGALGDFVQSLGPMKAIRHHHPDARITLLTTAPFESLAKASDYFDDIILDTRPKFYQLAKLLSLRAKFNAGNFSRVYDLQNNDRTEFYLKLFHPKPVWVGAAKAATIRNASSERTAGLAFAGHVQTLGLAGITNIEIDSMEWVQGRSDFEGLQKPYALLVPGSAPSRPEKRWPAQYYGALANMFADNGIQPVIIGTESERETTNAIADLCGRVMNLTGRTNLLDIVALARNAQCAIGNDTGPMHMIAPTGVPSLVLFSSHSNPLRHAPLGANVKTLQEKDLKDISVAKVWDSLEV